MCMSFLQERIDGEKKKKKGYVLVKTTVSINKSWPREPRAIFIYAWIYVYMYANICVYVYVCMYTHISMFIHIYKYI